jgi:hypothetical protein
MEEGTSANIAPSQWMMFCVDSLFVEQTIIYWPRLVHRPGIYGIGVTPALESSHDTGS